MPGVAIAVVDSILKVLGGFIVGYSVRDHLARRPGAQAASKAPAISVKKKAQQSPAAPAAAARPTEELKMVLCVNESLKMGKGKIGAQCAHAAVGVIQAYRHKQEAAFRHWERFGQPKIALKINDDAEMEALERKAAAAGMPTYIVCDAGRTQIPAGSQTVLAIGPAPKSLVDSVTGHLKLL